MTNTSEKKVCRQLGGHIDALTEDCDFSECEKSNAICSYGLSLLGILLLIIRFSSIPNYANILYASSFISIIAGFALIFQLRSTYMNGLMMTTAPLIVVLAIMETINFFSGNGTIWSITYHIPPFVIGVIVFLKRYDMTNLVAVTLGGISMVAWFIFIDFRIAQPSEFSWMLLVYIVPAIIISYDLYRNGSVDGLIANSFCNCK